MQPVRPFALILLAALLLGGCALPFQSATSHPSIAYPTGYQWRDAPKIAALSIPTTTTSPSPTVTIVATHRVGTGRTINAPSPLDEASRQGTRLLSQLAGQMKASGWKPLFSTAQTGSYPTLALYVTFKSSDHYCFIEYSAVEISAGQASQRIDIYYA
jgi:hypothetical protein